jgi:hypothetical protein
MLEKGKSSGKSGSDNRARVEHHSSPASYLKLPNLLQEIADATDFETAIAMAKARGGVCVYIARNPSAQNWLVKLVGFDKARAIGAALGNPAGGGMNHELPMAARVIRRMNIESVIRRTLASGRGLKDAALELGIHRHTVNIHARRMRAEGLLPPKNATGAKP